MVKPPETTPHSDLDGVHEDERRHTDVAVELGQDSGDVAEAKKQSIARPLDSDMRQQDKEDRDDRSQ